MKGKTQPTWTDAELAILRDGYEQAGGKHRDAWALIGDRLPGRSRHGAVSKAQQLGIQAGNASNHGGGRVPAALLDPPTLPTLAALLAEHPRCPDCGRGWRVDEDPEGGGCVVCWSCAERRWWR